MFQSNSPMWMVFSKMESITCHKGSNRTKVWQSPKIVMFKGHGIVILPLALLALFCGTMGFAIIFMFVIEVNVNWLHVIMGLWCAAAAVWLYAVTLGRSKQEQVYNPATGAYEMRVSRHALFFMSAKTWTWIFVVVALAGSALLPQVPMPKSIKGSSKPPSSASGGNTPGENTFQAANQAITTGRHGTALGNTQEAVRLAHGFSYTLKLLREEGVEKSKKKSAISLTEGEFLTYCHLTEDTCAFLVHVPELRKFSGDAKEFIADAAWHSATAVVLAMPNRPKRLAVGVRGVLLYDAILVGKVVASVEEAETGIERRLGNSRKGALYPFFADVTKNEKVPASNAAKSPESSLPADKASSETQPKMEAPVSGETTTPVTAPTPASPPAMPAPELLPTPVREWHSADGRLLKASLLGFNEAGTAARVKREDGTEFEVGIDKFAPEEQAELKRLHQSSQSK